MSAKQGKPAKPVPVGLRVGYLRSSVGDGRRLQQLIAAVTDIFEKGLAARSSGLRNRRQFVHLAQLAILQH